MRMDAPETGRVDPALVRHAPCPFAGRRVHLIGVGGSGMIGAAALLRAMGATVTGSDIQDFCGIEELRANGVEVQIGHDARFVGDATDLVVASAAVPTDNPELDVARRRGTPILRYAELLGALMAARTGVAIAGTHGKSTTTAMCVHLFRAGGLDPSFVIGARSEQLNGSSGAGSGPHFIAESCEFNRSFLLLRAPLAAVLNIEPDHLDYYRDVDDIVEAFGQFCGQVAPDGVLVCNGDDPRAMQVAREARCAVRTFGFGEGVDWRAVNLGSDRGRYRFDVVVGGRVLFSTHLSIPGRHNVANALAAAALADAAGVTPEVLADAFPEFTGVQRRMTLLSEERGVFIVDDYAHHPTEIQVTIEAARDRYHPRRTWVIFQPHQYSRTRYFLNEFARSFGDADRVVICDIYSAREVHSDYGRLGSQELVARIAQHGGRAEYLSTLGEVTEYLSHEVIEGDMVLTMGAGDVWKVADGLAQRLRG
jgi:UDP-N-acetylmuramate--alanine ligase